MKQKKLRHKPRANKTKMTNNVLIRQDVMAVNQTSTFFNVDESKDTEGDWSGVDGGAFWKIRGLHDPAGRVIATNYPNDDTIKISRGLRGSAQRGTEQTVPIWSLSTTTT